MKLFNNIQIKNCYNYEKKKFLYEFNIIFV